MPPSRIRVLKAALYEETSRKQLSPSLTRRLQSRNRASAFFDGHPANSRM